jgi:hypothetical protein
VYVSVICFHPPHPLSHVCTQGCDLTDEELIDHISEATTMSKSLEEYEGGWVRGEKKIKECLTGNRKLYSIPSQYSVF